MTWLWIAQMARLSCSGDPLSTRPMHYGWLFMRRPGAIATLLPDQVWRIIGTGDPRGLLRGAPQQPFLELFRNLFRTAARLARILTRIDDGRSDRASHGADLSVEAEYRAHLPLLPKRMIARRLLPS